MTGIKEILELITGLKDLAIIGKGVMKDGKFDLQDLAVLGELLSKHNELVAAFSGLADLTVEFKEVDITEATQLISAIFEAAREVKAA